MPRYAVLAVALAAFALGRCTGAPTTTHEEATLHEAPSAPQTTGMRSSSVVRREGPTAEKKTPRPPR